MQVGVELTEHHKNIATELMVSLLNDNGALNKLEPLKLPKKHLLNIAYQVKLLSDKGLDNNQIIKKSTDERTNLFRELSFLWETL